MSITTNPQPGDAVILNLSQWGHTGIITYAQVHQASPHPVSATSSDSIKILEQNASPGYVSNVNSGLLQSMKFEVSKDLI
jgi:hypothetical protein